MLDELRILQILFRREFGDIQFTIGIYYIRFRPGTAKGRPRVNQLIQPTLFAAVAPCMCPALMETNMETI